MDKTLESDFVLRGGRSSNAHSLAGKMNPARAMTDSTMTSAPLLHQDAGLPSPPEILKEGRARAGSEADSTCDCRPGETPRTAKWATMMEADKTSSAPLLGEQANAVAYYVVPSGGVTHVDIRSGPSQAQHQPQQAEYVQEYETHRRHSQQSQIAHEQENNQQLRTEFPEVMLTAPSQSPDPRSTSSKPNTTIPAGNGVPAAPPGYVWATVDPRYVRPTSELRGSYEGGSLLVRSESVGLEQGASWNLALPATNKVWRKSMS